MSDQKNILDTYGENFQRGVLKVIVDDPTFYRSIKEYLLPKYFSISYLRTPYECIREFFTSYGRVPEFDTIEHLIRARLANHEVEKNICIAELFKLKHQQGFKDEKYIKDKIISFCKIQECINSIENSITIIDDYKNNSNLEPDFQSIYESFKKVLNIRSDQVNSDIIKNFDDFFLKEGRRNMVPTGWKMLDYLLAGGMGAGEVHTIAGYLGNGKTTSIINIGAEIFKMGKKVLHFTFENPQDYIAHSYYSCISMIPRRNLFRLRHEAKEYISQYEGGGLHVQEYPMKRYNVNALESYYEQLVDQNYIPDIIIIDSPLHLKPIEKTAEKTDQLGNIWKDIKGFAQIIEKPLLVTAQLNRSSAQETDNDTDKVGDSIDIARDSDSFISINRTRDDKITDKGRFFIGKNRFGKDGFGWNIKWNGHLCRIQEDEEEANKLITEFQKSEQYEATV